MWMTPLLWEMIKMNIRESSIKYRAGKKKHQKTKQILLQEQISVSKMRMLPTKEKLGKL